ncbi:SRPBCC family protein [Streptomyces broussonetiae]|uniref:SRPBCC family protein n=1 Tax=Streptomyces broussonetiae TaxID=2686304 RepID=A0ABV5EM13_9ACTN
MIVVLNVHERALPASPERVGALIDSLGSGDDRLWPPDWPPVRFEGPLAVGVAGGHGPVRYRVSHYVPGQWVRCRFTGRGGFEGFHEFAVESLGGDRAVLRNTMVLRPSGIRVLGWLLFFRPLHNTAFEQCLDRAELAVTGHVMRPVRWSRYVRLLRRLSAWFVPRWLRSPYANP